MARKVRSIAKLEKADLRMLSRRYLLWFYKATKDEVDKIERKFTQLEMDREIEKLLEKEAKLLGAATSQGVAPHLKAWREYVFEKESEAQKLKFSDDGRIQPEYLFLHLKLKAVERVTTARFGRKTLCEFKKICETAAVKRIAEDASGRR